MAPPPPLHITQHVIRNALNPKTTFRGDLCHKIKIFGCIGFGIAALALVKSQIR